MKNFPYFSKHRFDSIKKLHDNLGKTNMTTHFETGSKGYTQCQVLLQTKQQHRSILLAFLQVIQQKSEG